MLFEVLLLLQDEKLRMPSIRKEKAKAKEYKDVSHGLLNEHDTNKHIAAEFDEDEQIEQ